MKFALKHGRPGNCCQVRALYATSVLDNSWNFLSPKINSPMVSVHTYLINTISVKYVWSFTYCLQDFTIYTFSCIFLSRKVCSVFLTYIFVLFCVLHLPHTINTSSRPVKAQMNYYGPQKGVTGYATFDRHNKSTMKTHIVHALHLIIRFYKCWCYVLRD